jgi:uncharacterized protein YndB with AHSA1/START domain
MTANIKVDGTIELELRREFPFPREMVFDAWLNEDHLAKWMGPTDEITMEGIRVDASEGGGYRMTFVHPDDDRDTVYGVYKTIKRPDKLVFTWIWETEEGEEEIETLVTVDFNKTSSGTEIVLLHQKFASQESCDHHNKGWIGCLDKFGRNAEKLK